MKRLELDEATGLLADYVRQLTNDPVVVTVNGDPVAALVAVEGMDWESFSLSTNPDFLDLIEQSRARHRAEGGLTSDEVRREFGLERKPRRGKLQPASPDEPIAAKRK